MALSSVLCASCHCYQAFVPSQDLFWEQRGSLTVPCSAFSSVFKGHFLWHSGDHTVPEHPTLIYTSQPQDFSLLLCLPSDHFFLHSPAGHSALEG